MKKIITFLFVVVFVFQFSNLFALAGNMEKVLKDINAGTRPASDLTIIYKAGNPNYKGMTLLTISGDGKVKLVRTVGNKKDSYTGQIDDKGMKALIAAMLDEKYWNAKTTTGTVPKGTSVMTITVKTKQNDLSHKLTCSEYDALTDKSAQTTYRILKSLVDTVSGGKVKY